MAHIAKTVALSVALFVVGAVSLTAQAVRAVPRISIDELKVLMDQKAVVVLDVREPAAFEQGRIPGAINVNYTDVSANAGRFAGETRTIVAYCACSREMTAARAAVDLAAADVPGAKALLGGWDEWVARGEKVER